MYKNKIAVFFSIVFLTFIIAPTLITVLDSSVDISFIYSNSEEESSSKQAEKTKIKGLTLFNKVDLLSNKRKRILIENVNKNIVVFIKNKKNYT